MSDTTREPAGVATRVLWFGVAGGLLAWALHLAIGFVLVYDGCALGMANLRLAVGGVTLVLGLVALIAMLASYRAYRRAPQERDEPAAARDERARFMAFLGMWLSGLGLLIILLLVLPVALLSPCG